MSHWSDELLQSMSLVGDPPADDVVRAVFDEHGIDQVNAIMRHLVINDDLIPDGLPSIVQDYLQKSAKLPEWADDKLLAQGLSVFNLNGPEIVMLLFGASLPVVYADPKIAQVLFLTTNLTQNAFRRIIETAQFVVDVTEPDAFDHSGRGIRTVQKVRLMHAAIRHLIENDPRWLANWESPLDVPISQLHLLGTLLSFSTTILQGLDLLNIHLSTPNRDAFMHLWKVIGHLLGIQDILLPDNYDESVVLMDHWRKRFQARTVPGEQLMAALLKLIDSYLDDPVTKGLIVNWMRIWIGDEASALLSVPPANWTRAIVPAERLIFGWLQRTEYRSRILAHLARGLSRKLLVGAVDFERGGNRPQFRMPRTLSEAVGMEPLKAKINQGPNG